jgi:FkbH-like protein
LTRFNPEDADYFGEFNAARRLTENTLGYPEVRVAVLGDSTTSQLVQVLRSVLYKRGLFARVYEAGFNVIDQEVIDPSSGLYQFAPDYVLLNVTRQGLRERYYGGSGPKDAFAAETCAAIEGWWTAISSRATCRIIQNLYELPLDRPYGNFTVRVENSFLSTVAEINRRLIASAGKTPNVWLNDIEYLSAAAGKAHWSDEKLWFHAKLFCNLEHLPAVARSIAAIILAGSGREKKCLVLDLDNTLWGGIVGDDGLEGIDLGKTAVGEAHVLFQRYILSLKQRGLILAVCSKNELANALEPFRKHPDMVLREEDIAVFVANWNPKSDNIRHIAETLKIGLDSFVYLDDSPFEREQVRTALPEVCAPELPEDPAEFIPFLSRANLFETLSASAEDAQRTAYYREEAARSRLKAEFTDIGDYLKSLQMEGQFSRFNPQELPRIAQLIQRSNQFNLTTKRYSELECQAFMTDPSSFSVMVRLKDRLGDYGLISVIICKVEQERLRIDTWLMSCRVLKRGVEHFSMNRVFAFAQKAGCREVVGTYAPTSKNGMVREFYKQFGFVESGRGPSGESHWTLPVRDYREFPVHIKGTGEEA